MKKIIYILVVLLVLGGVVWLIVTPGKPGKLDAFATCIKDSGTKFYGAFWCSHCQAQKARFGKSERLLPYIECSTPDSKGQLQVCRDANIMTYPTWDFATSSFGPAERVVGEMELVDLAKRTSCVLPQ